MKTTSFVLATQLQTDPSFVEPSKINNVLSHVYQAAEVGKLDMLAVGGPEAPTLFETLTSQKQRALEQVYLWYTVLADHPTLQPAHIAINYRGNRLHRQIVAETQQPISEHFQFACPNHPGVKAHLLAHLDALLQRYDFDGVFLDKIRFPSPANGLDGMGACFCPHCQRAAAEFGLDLAQVRAMLVNPNPSSTVGKRPGFATASGAAWLDALLKGLPLIQQFLIFRANAITRLVGEISALVRQHGKQLALDLFSPGLALLVGQDYQALSAHATWCKPMVYRYANGPAGLRMEIPKLMHTLETFTGTTPNAAWAFATRWVPELAEITLPALKRGQIPLSLIATEAASAVGLFAPQPVYVGVEAVSLPVFEVNLRPEQVQQLIQTARAAGAAGAVLSWDVLAMPLENIRAARIAADSAL